MLVNKTKVFIFTVDTDKFSGNFEREMFAYLTGVNYEYYHPWAQQLQKETRDEYAKMDPSPNEFFEDNLVYSVNEDTDQTNRVAYCIMPTPGWWNNGSGTHHKGKPPKDRRTYDAYQSVGIKLRQFPPKWIRTILIERAKHYCTINRHILGEPAPLQFLGCRMVEKTLTTKSFSRKL